MKCSHQMQLVGLVGCAVCILLYLYPILAILSSSSFKQGLSRACNTHCAHLCGQAPQRDCYLNTPTWLTDRDLKERVLQLVDRKAGPRDPEVLEVIRDLLDPPSQHGIHKLASPLTESPQSKAVRAALQNMVSLGYIQPFVWHLTSCSVIYSHLH